MFEYKHKIYNWLREAERESAMSARRSNQSGKSSSSRSSKNSYSSSYSEKSRSIKDREIEEKAKLAELQAKIQFLEQRQRAENQAETLKVHEEMAGAKARMEVYRSHDEVNAEEGSIPTPMKEKRLEFGRPLREDCNNNQKEIVRYAEKISCSRSPRVSNRRDADAGQIAMRQIKEVWQEVQSMNINMQMDRAYNATLEQRTKEFKSNRYGNQKDDCCQNNLLLMLIMTCLMTTPWNLTISCQYLRRRKRAMLTTQEAD